MQEQKIPRRWRGGFRKAEDGVVAVAPANLDFIFIQPFEIFKLVLFFLNLPLPRVTIQVDHQFLLLHRRRKNYAEPHPCGNWITGSLAYGPDRSPLISVVSEIILIHQKELFATATLHVEFCLANATCVDSL